MRDSDLILKWNMFITLLLGEELVRKRGELCLLSCKKKTAKIILSQSHGFHGLTHDFRKLMVGNISRSVKPFQLNIIISLIYGAKSIPSKQIHFLLNLTEASGCSSLVNLALFSDRKYGPCHDSGIFKSQYLLGYLTEIRPLYFLLWYVFHVMHLTCILCFYYYF